MSKYNQLWHYFHKRHEAEIDLSFDTIQNILGFSIDHSFLNYKKEVEVYGYRVKKIYLKEKRVVFEKLNNKG
jgi:predicted nucleotidyltransferase